MNKSVFLSIRHSYRQQCINTTHWNKKAFPNTFLTILMKAVSVTNKYVSHSFVTYHRAPMSGAMVQRLVRGGADSGYLSYRYAWVELVWHKAAVEILQFLNTVQTHISIPYDKSSHKKKQEFQCREQRDQEKAFTTVIRVA